jgi:hypothetical protein
VISGRWEINLSLASVAGPARSRSGHGSRGGLLQWPSLTHAHVVLLRVGSGEDCSTISCDTVLFLLHGSRYRSFQFVMCAPVEVVNTHIGFISSC